MKKLFALMFGCAIIPATGNAQTIKHTDSQNSSLVQYVHPIIGTQRMGHVFPGATVPFGM